MKDLRAIGTFPLELEESLLEVSGRTATVIEAVCGRGAKAKDVSKQFGLHAKLGWQFWNLAYHDPFSALKYWPSEKGLEQFLQSAESLGVAEEARDSLRSSVRSIQGTFSIHAEDREKLEMLLDSRRTPQDEESVQRWRKHSFLGNTFTFGAYTKSIVSTGILFPADEDGGISFVRIQGYIGLVRTRADVRWPISTFVVQGGEQPFGTMTKEPLFPGHDGPVPLITEYCSSPVPRLERRTEGDVVYDEVSAGIVGLTGTCTLFMGEIVPHIGSMYAQEADEEAFFGTGVRTPSEWLVMDHIVHRSLFPGVKRTLKVFNELGSPFARGAGDRLDVPEKLAHLGHGLSRVHTAELPNYGTLLQNAFKRIGFDPNEFDVYRVTMPYPPMPVSVMVCHEMLPPRP